MPDEVKEEIVEEEPHEEPKKKRKGYFRKQRMLYFPMLTSKLLSLVHLFALPFLPGREES